MTPTSFGDYVKSARENKGISIRKLTRRLGVEPTSVSRLESGKHTLPHPDLFIGLIRELNLHWSTALHFLPPYERLCKTMTAFAFDELGTNISKRADAKTEEQ